MRSVIFLLGLLEEGSGGASSSSSGSGSNGNSVGGGAPNSPGGASGGGSGGVGDTRPVSPSGSKLVPLSRLTDDLRRLRVGLSPLRSIEQSLVRVISNDNPRQVGAGSAALPSERAFEVSVRSGSRWKSFFRGSDAGALSKASSQGYEDLRNARRVIEACREDIVALWNHPAVQGGLTQQCVSLEFQSGLCVRLSQSPPFFAPTCLFEESSIG